MVYLCVRHRGTYYSKLSSWGGANTNLKVTEIDRRVQAACNRALSLAGNSLQGTTRM